MYLLAREHLRHLLAPSSELHLMFCFFTSPSQAPACPVKITCIQLFSSKDRHSNLFPARKKVLEAAQNKADIVVLPEWLDQYAESIPPATSGNLDLGR